MARYINADDLKHDIAVLFKNNEELIDGWLVCLVDDVIEEHKACGGVELVQCKDCIYSQDKRACSLPYGENGYCPLGKRREDD